MAQKDYGTHKVRGLSIPGALFNQGNSYFVDPTNGSDSNDGLSMKTAKATLAAGEDLLEAGQNDTLYYLAGTSSLSLTGTLTWDKAYTHLVGVCAETNVGQRARVFMTAGVADTPMINITASGCSFRNLYFFHGIDDAAALINVAVSGGRNFFKNVHFAGIGHATQGDEAGAASLSLAGAEECLFEDCTIGVDTIARSTTNAEIACTSAAVRNTFRNCDILSFADNAGHLFLSAGSGGLDRWIKFERCRFINAVESTATAMTQAMNIHNTAGGLVLLHDCIVVGATDIAAADNGNVLADNAYAAGTSGIGIAVTR